jgi:hypothetical protein
MLRTVEELVAEQLFAGVAFSNETDVAGKICKQKAAAVM